MASNPRDDRSSVREMKLPAALLTRPVSGAFAENLFDHRVDRGGVADVDAVARDASAMCFHEFVGGRLADALAPAADGDFGAEAKKPLGHRLAEPRAAAGDEDFFARKQAVDEHVLSLARRSASAAGSRLECDAYAVPFG